MIYNLLFLSHFCKATHGAICTAHILTSSNIISTEAFHPGASPNPTGYLVSGTRPAIRDIDSHIGTFSAKLL